MVPARSHVSPPPCYSCRVPGPNQALRSPHLGVDFASLVVDLIEHPPASRCLFEPSPSLQQPAILARLMLLRLPFLMAAAFSSLPAC